VLLVEDDVDIRASLRLLLETEDYPVLEAPDGHDGLQILAAAQTSLVVLVDYMMPVMNGLQLLREVGKDQQLARRNRYVLVTANYERLSAADSDLLTALDVIRVKKPFDITTVLDVVERACLHLSRDPVDMTDAMSPSPPCRSS
jgi:CheY-like chemotaxis protein